MPKEYVGLTNPLDSSAIPGGAQAFAANCQSCHGPQGHGDGPVAESLSPRPKNLAALQLTVADDYLFWRINEGKPGTAMVAWKSVLSAQTIWEVITFIRTLPN